LASSSASIRQTRHSCPERALVARPGSSLEAASQVVWARLRPSFAAWWAIRIAEKHRANLKWIAVYRVLPIAAVTHLAEIDHIEPYGDSGKYKVVFKGSAVPLKKTIPFGDAITGSMQGPRYTTRKTLLVAHTVKDLF
jgi:hypothetical protein